MTGTKPLSVAAVLAAVLLSAPGQGSTPLLLDQPAPPFRLRGVDGAILALADLRGRFIVLHFGASW